MPPRWPFGFGKRPALVDVQPFGESHGGWCSRVSNGNERGKIPKVSQQSLTKKRVCCSLQGCWARLRPPMKREAYYHGRYTQTCTRDWWKKISSLASSHRHNTQRYITHSRVSANSFCSSGSLSFILSNSVQVEATCASAELWTCVRLSVSVWPGSSESRAWSCRLGHCALSALQSNAALLFFSHPKCLRKWISSAKETWMEFRFSRTLNNLCDSCVEMSLRRWLPEYTAVDISHIISDIHSILYSTDRGVYKGAVVH